MYETEANDRIGTIDEVPTNIVAKFLEFRDKIQSRTLLPWGEHCTECVWPTCYTSCDLYLPREDGRCRRFVDGMVRIDCARATNSYLLKIRFKRWGKLWAPGNLRLFTAAEAEREERSDRKIGAAIVRLPIPAARKFA